ncbi:hypothetical protein RHMOL_Rhmol01G0176200 [Rhododendron molle]|uniref:Uncharacterized protein n=1 Tax=Rhododendron molle TaxID=49168 RepID=A0ACC0Q297_RHOML|nr:hypothetical protein RHMOL_Rhmol01G0176200 [Rhododendron molle]
MREKGLTKDVGCNWFNVGCVNSFMSKDIKHPWFDEIYETLEQLVIRMKDLCYRPGLGSEIGTIPEFVE